MGGSQPSGWVLLLQGRVPDARAGETQVSCANPEHPF